ncbi:sphingomyelin phosphodiesterase-like [Mizuhopecten yessoensis]|uniref:sphingomyelin phosphodiesterase-like n=1 Tax=Mizuhopecten yessoensis TaxID=6573 RepID=UPI000B45953A|nr:sphingomyelin phosphodiesterase-like [Mizuhopecten yessoensis]
MDAKTVLLVSLCAVIVTLVSAPWVYNRYKSGSETERDVAVPADTVHPMFENRYLPSKVPSYKRFVSKCGTMDFGAVGCSICKVAVAGLQSLVKKKSTQEDVVVFATELCKVFEIEDSRDELFGVAERLALTPAQACGILIGTNCGTPNDPNVMWNVTLPNIPKPPVTPPTTPKPGSLKLRMLHLTDIHLDPAYNTGANTDCGEPLCCRKQDGTGPSPDTRAGKWGSHAMCDTPFITLDSLFAHLSSIQDQFDYVIFTGDLPPHNIWNQSRTDQLTSLQTYTKLFKKYLPEKVVFNALGNHESAPVNSFPPDFIKDNQSISWLYEALTDSWGTWLPKAARQDILRGAFYSVSPSPGFRIISLNMNFCNNGNWWLLINTTDPNGQLQWLITELQKAETSSEKVHIIGHIFPGSSDCLKAWSWNYFKIVNRYESTIAGQFFGHSHSDFYEVMYDNVNFTRPISVVYIPGSVTTFANLNPGFRIYELDGFYNGSSWAALNFQNYFLNLTDVNVSDKPNWELEYDAKADLNLTSLFPQEWDNLIYRMKADDDLFQKFYRYYMKSAPAAKCTGDCKTKLLCDLRTGRSHDPSLCANI